MARISSDRRLKAVGVAFAAFAVVLASVIAGGLLFEKCSNRELSRVDDPSGRYVAVVFERKCDLTEAWISHVRIAAANEALTDEAIGNAFIGSERLGPSDGGGLAPDARIHWDGSRLVVVYFADDRAQIVGSLPAGASVAYHPRNEL